MRLGTQPVESAVLAVEPDASTAYGLSHMRRSILMFSMMCILLPNSGEHLSTMPKSLVSSLDLI